MEVSDGGLGSVVQFGLEIDLEREK